MEKSQSNKDTFKPGKSPEETWTSFLVPHLTEVLDLLYGFLSILSTEPTLWRLQAAPLKPVCPTARPLQQEKPPPEEAVSSQLEGGSHSPQREKSWRAATKAGTAKTNTLF